ncbi:MAG TPA: response regulator transcription factor [Flavitalea sp.]|nr:response regulator transcription factor [Flavitalea sp.]
MKITETIKVALADDHTLLRNALATLIDNFEDCKVIVQAGSGEELINYIKNGSVPDVVLLDLNMPNIDGYETAKWIQLNKPEIYILMLTMYDTEQAMIRLLQAGVNGFLKKDIHPSELKFAIHSVMQSGYYYSHNTTGKLVNLFRKGQDNHELQKALLSQTELIFLKHACSEMTYKEIAGSMNLNPRAVDNLRDNLFTKLDVKSRVGLAMYSIRHGIVTF